jgi:hypothetical protein
MPFRRLFDTEVNPTVLIVGGSSYNNSLAGKIENVRRGVLFQIYGTLAERTRMEMTNGCSSRLGSSGTFARLVSPRNKENLLPDGWFFSSSSIVVVVRWLYCWWWGRRRRRRLTKKAVTSLQSSFVLLPLCNSMFRANHKITGFFK